MAGRLRQAELEFDRLFRHQTEITTHVDELKEFVVRGLEPLEAISRRQGDTGRAVRPIPTGCLRPARRTGRALRPAGNGAKDRGPAGTNGAKDRATPARSGPRDRADQSPATGQLELEQELARCADQLHEFQVQLRGARRRLKKLSKNRIIRALRHGSTSASPGDGHRPTAVSPGSIFAQQMQPKTLGHIEVRRETNRFADGLSRKSLLPSLERSVISPGDCLKPTA